MTQVLRKQGQRMGQEHDEPLTPQAIRDYGYQIMAQLTTVRHQADRLAVLVFAQKLVEGDQEAADNVVHLTPR